MSQFYRIEQEYQEVLKVLDLEKHCSFYGISRKQAKRDIICRIKNDVKTDIKAEKSIQETMILDISE